MLSLTVEQLLHEMQVGGVSRAVLLTMDIDSSDVNIPEVRSRIERNLSQGSDVHFRRWTFDDVAEMVRVLFRSVGKIPTNREIADLVKKYPDKFIGFGSIDICKGADYVAKKLREIDDLRLSGIKVLPTGQFFNPIGDKGFEMVCEYSEKTGKVIMYHTGCDPMPFENPAVSADANPKHLDPILERYKPKIILAHMGSYSGYYPGIWLEEALSLIKKYENVYGDTSAASWVLFKEGNIKKIRETIGFDRVLFGSDRATVATSTIPHEVGVIKSCEHLTEEEKAKILGLNAAKLLRIK
jgi:predicted TIM-barrel fold metal-dependent hydrolase